MKSLLVCKSARMLLIFFFSSRRRHTRYWRDWSSDVCSSDLVHFYAGTHGAELRERTLDALRRGVPIFISECGSSEASGDGKLDVDSWNTWIQDRKSVV